MKNDRSPYLIIPGIFCCLLSSTVLLGWFLGIPSLIQVLPTVAPMQFNTSLGFLISGIGLIALGYRIRALVFITGAAVLAIGFLTFCQYVFEVDLNIDELLIKHYITTKTSHPGRMAPNTALAFLIVGITLLINTLPYLYRGQDVVIKLNSLLILFLGGLSLLGNLLQVESLYGRNSFTIMALHTSIGFVVIGTGFFLNNVVYANKKIKLKNLMRISLLSAIALFSITVILWHEIRSQEEGLIKNSLENESLYINKNITQAFNTNFLALIRMANRLKSDREIPQEEWEQDANKYLEDFLGIKAIARTDVNFRENLINSIKPIDKQNLNNFFNSNLYKIRSAPSDEVRFHFIDETPFLIITIPINANEQKEGYLVGMYNIKELVESIIPVTLLINNCITLNNSTSDILKMCDDTEQYLPEWAIESKVQFLNQNWVQTIIPSSKTISSKISGLAEIIFIFGTLITILIVIIIELAQTSHSQTIRLKESETNLTKAVKQLTDTNKELDQFAYVASHDLKAPLRVIGNAAKWLEEDLKSAINGDTKEYLELIQKRTARMSKLLDDLLEYSRIGKNLNENYTRLVSGKELMHDVLQLIELPDEFKTHISPKFNDIKVNLMPMKQIMLNLVSNAIKHHDKKNGQISISVDEEIEKYVFRVEDDGPGIPQEFHDQVFDMFRTLKPRDQVEGSGMGLAFIKKQLENFDGTIKIESAEKRGSAFIFTLPKGK